jgi:hypothetical protein
MVVFKTSTVKIRELGYVLYQKNLPIVIFNIQYYKRRRYRRSGLVLLKEAIRVCQQLKSKIYNHQVELGGDLEKLNLACSQLLKQIKMVVLFTSLCQMTNLKHLNEPMFCWWSYCLNVIVLDITEQAKKKWRYYYKQVKPQG